MRIIFTLTTAFFIFLTSCSVTKKKKEVSQPNWDSHYAEVPANMNLEGSSYLSTYSQIYTRSDERLKDLCVTVSMRNMNPEDTIYVSSASYYDDHGAHIKDYLERSIRLLPLETLEIVIDEVDPSGGTGGNFLFHWQMDSLSIEPLFEAVMISTTGQQGISFLTKGHRIK